MSKKMLIDFPTSFPKIEYPKKNLRFSTTNEGTKELFEKLLKSSNYRCMYCGADLSKGETHKIKGTFEKEHTVGKTQGGKVRNYLLECKFNFSVACRKCNSLKEKSIKNIDSTYYENDEVILGNCNEKECEKICSTLFKSTSDYLNKNKIIISPYGVFNKNTYEKLKIEYDYFEREFKPSTKHKYSEGDIFFIEKHIERFKLNKRFPTVLSSLITELSDFDGKLPKLKNISNENRYDNVLDDLFLVYLESLNKKKQKMIISRIRKKILKEN